MLMYKCSSFQVKIYFFEQESDTFCQCSFSCLGKLTYFLKKDHIQFVMRKFSFHAMKIAISWLFLGKGKTQEGAGLCDR